MSTKPSTHRTGRARDNGPQRHGLQVLGLSPQAEALYRLLLRSPGAMAAQLVQQAGCSLGDVEDQLAALQARGLVSHARDRSRGWQAVAPDVAIEILLLEKQAELNEARKLVPELRLELAQESPPAALPAVETVPADSDAHLEAYSLLWEQARSTVLNVLRPPFSAGGPRLRAAQTETSRRGVHVRHLLAPELLKWPGCMAMCAQATAAGEEVRMAEGLPTRLTLADDEVAVVPVQADEANGPLLRVRDSALLDILIDYGERLWSQATPVLSESDDGAVASAHADSEAALRELVTVLAAGTNDKSAAHLLGISDRTLQRRIGLLSTRLRARSRFQCGWLAARQFDLPEPPAG